MTLDIYAKTGKMVVNEVYRLYADGTIMDQETGKIAGYITKSEEIDEVFWMKSIKEQQQRLKEYLK